MKTLALRNPYNAPVFHEEILSSTFDAARILAANNSAHGTVICADLQEAGRGRQNRSWKTEKGKSLLFTILLRYGDFSSIPEALTLKTGLAVSLAVEDLVPALAGLVQIKWPNDIMIRPAVKEQAFKAAGILTETDGSTVYIGAGVNVAQKEFPEEYRHKAGSIIRAFPALDEGIRFPLLERILSRLYDETEKPQKDWRERLHSRLYKKGEPVSFAEGPAESGRVIEGILSGIGKGGELLIISKGGKERTFVTGELQVYQAPSLLLKPSAEM
jgi:BirA family biotin operon repressor/biotin-[acetyl-CoA-carboxylase] ligase